MLEFGKKALSVQGFLIQVKYWKPLLVNGKLLIDALHFLVGKKQPPARQVMESAAVDHVDKQFAKFVLRAQSVGGITRLDDEPEQ